MKRYWFRLPGSFYAQGPTTAAYKSEGAARAAIRDSLGVARLPSGTEVWEFAGHATELSISQRRAIR